MTKLSTVIITLNEEDNLPRCIDSVKEISDEIVVVDSGSTDRTRDIATEAGCRIFDPPFIGYGQHKQFGVDHAANDWILSMDADEILTPELTREIRILMEGNPDYKGYYIRFLLNYMGRIMNRGKVGNEKKLRLYNRNYGKFTYSSVHEKVELEVPAGTLKNVALHYSYKNLAHHLVKINRYTSQAAEGALKEGKKYPPSWVIFKFPISFITYFIFKGGVLNGYPGFIWSLLAAFYGSLKIAKTIELTRKSA